ncbi:MAG: glycosyltransferase family 2 protein [Bacilli bacterium]|nr:MAG: glycosyltransferase family 2 protein [Bacilli bacterium]
MPNGTPNPLLRWAIKNIDLGDYLCFLDDDNIYKDDYLEKNG